MNAKKIGCFALLFIAMVTITLGIIVEMNHPFGFIRGWAHGFIFLPRAVLSWFMGDFKFVAATNWLYLSGYIMGALTTLLMIRNELRKRKQRTG